MNKEYNNQNIEYINRSKLNEGWKITYKHSIILLNNITKDNLSDDELLNITWESNEMSHFPNEAQDIIILHASIKAPLLSKGVLVELLVLPMVSTIS